MSSKKWFKNNRPLKLKENQCYSDSIKEIDCSEFPIIEDFEIVLHEHKGSMGWHIRYHSKSLGILSSFPWWDNVDRDLRRMSIDEVPLGSVSNPFEDLEQGWQLVIWQKRDYVYIIEGDNPCCCDFHSWFRVDKSRYISEWDRILNVFNR